MSSLTKGLIVIIILLATGAGLVLWKSKVGAHHGAVENISKEEMELLLADLNPMMLRQIAQSPEAKKELAGNLEELFALASQAKKEGLAADIEVKRELENTETEILALTYDKEVIRKDKQEMPAFSMITEDRMKQFWDGADAQPSFWDKIGLGANSAEAREKAFNKFLDGKLKLARESGALNREITEEERQSAREYFAKTRIYAEEARQKGGELGDAFWRKVELQTDLQQAQFLARLYAQEHLAKKTEVTEADVEKYIKEHPEEIGNSGEKRAKGEEILNRLKSGEDFGKLAEEFSEDPGSKAKGGLYEGISRGSFDPTFESAALALEPGQFTQSLVETPFGFHIIKLEKKGMGTGQTGAPTETFDVRHILLSTMMKDPENPMAREIPVKQFVRQKLEQEKEKKVLEEIKKNNPVEVAENFEVQVPPMTEQPELPPGMMAPPSEMPEEAPETAPAEKPQPKKK